MPGGCELGAKGDDTRLVCEPSSLAVLSGSGRGGSGTPGDETAGQGMQSHGFRIRSIEMGVQRFRGSEVARHMLEHLVLGEPSL